MEKEKPTLGTWEAPAETETEPVLQRLMHLVRAALKHINPDPALDQNVFIKQFDALPEAYRTLNGRALTWREVYEAIPNLHDFVRAVASLDMPELYWVNENGQLVIGDGGLECLPELTNRNYNPAREEAMSVPGRALITEEEYMEKNRGQFEQRGVVWLESGPDATSAVKVANVMDGQVRLWREKPSKANSEIGVRRVVRTDLKFKT